MYKNVELICTNKSRNRQSLSLLMYIFSKETRKSEWKTQHENDQESKAAGSATATKLIKSCRGRRIDGQSPVEAKAAFYFGSVLALCNFVQDVESSPCGQG